MTLKVTGSKFPPSAGQASPKCGIYDLSERCVRCDQEFGDHSAKAPHAALYRNGLPVGPPCGGFVPHLVGQAKKIEAAKRAKKVQSEFLGVPNPAGQSAFTGRLRDPWSALS